MCCSGTESDLPNWRNDLFKGAPSKRNEGHARTPPRLTVLADQSARDSGLPVRPGHGWIGLKPPSLRCLTDKAGVAAGRRRHTELVYHFRELQPPPGGCDDFETSGWPIFRTRQPAGLLTRTRPTAPMSGWRNRSAA